MKQRVIIVTQSTPIDEIKALPMEEQLVLIIKTGSTISIDFLTALSGREFYTITIPNIEDETHIAFAFGRVYQIAKDMGYFIDFLPNTPKKLVNFFTKMSNGVLDANAIKKDKTKTVRNPKNKIDKNDSDAEKDDSNENSKKSSSENINKPIKDEPTITSETNNNITEKESMKDEYVAPSDNVVNFTKDEYVAPSDNVVNFTKDEYVAPSNDVVNFTKDEPVNTSVNDTGLIFTSTEEINNIAKEIIAEASVDEKYTEGIIKTLSVIKQINTLKTLLQMKLSVESVTSSDIEKIYNVAVNKINNVLSNR